jgi:outer membrane protein assembly factor BamB
VDYRSRWQQKRRARATRRRLIVIAVCVLGVAAMVVSWRARTRAAPTAFQFPARDVCWLTAGPDYLLVTGRSGRLVRIGPGLSDAPSPWLRDFTHPAGFLGPAAVTESLALVGCTDVRLRAVDLRTGQQVWEIATSGAVTGVTVEDDQVYFGSEDRHAYAAGADGALHWKGPDLGGKVVAAPLVTSEGIVVATLAGTVHCLAAGDGHELWRVTTGAPIYAPPRLGPSTILVGDDAGKLHSLSPDGKTVLTHDLEGVIRGSVGIAGEVVVAGDSSGLLVRINPRDMTELWRARLPGPIATEPAVAGASIWCGAGRSLVAVNTTSGRIVRRLRAEAEITDVLFAFGHLYWATTDGRVMVVDDP